MNFAKLLFGLVGMTAAPSPETPNLTKARCVRCNARLYEDEFQLCSDCRELEIDEDARALSRI